jgi:predicted DNA-binding transcriptional regulator AlpA
MEGKCGNPREPTSKHAYPGRAVGNPPKRKTQTPETSMNQSTIETARAILSAAIPDRGERAEVLAMLKPPAPRKDKLLTTAEAAKIAGVHSKTLFHWEDKGYLHPRRITPSRVRWSRNELEEFLCESAEG